MGTPEKQYLQALRSACEEIRLDYFPQVEASELLYKVITLGDIYLPLTLEKFDGSYRQYHDFPQLEDTFSQRDIEDLIRRIDEKIAELEKKEEAEKARAQLSALDAGGTPAPPAIVPDERYSVSGSESTGDQPSDLFSDDIAELPDEAIEPEPEIGMRLLLRAEPGAGKTTFCKRLVLAYLDQDSAFFNKYAEENGLCFNRGYFPLLLNCKNIVDLSTSDILEKSFPALVYQLCSLGMGHHIVSVPEESFIQLFENKLQSGLFLILDGWDEILDSEKETAFTGKLNLFLSSYPRSDFMVTARYSYLEPKLIQPFYSTYCIKGLSPFEIREFCRKWCDILLSTTSQKKNSHERIAEQIINSSDPQVGKMRKNPLDLSLLLTVSKNDGRLPDNKADLFKEIVDLYIFWSTIKRAGVLSSKSIRVFLSYTASYFTKNNILFCSYDKLTTIVNQCITDLEWTFSEDLSHTGARIIIKELSHTGILTCTYDGNNYTFAESGMGSHRQMQEYLTAYAILLQYADEEYNSMSPVEIFEDKYGNPKWSEVILFIALMNNGRLRHELIKRLIAKAQDTSEDNYNYTNLLFDMVVNGADIRPSDKHTIYDVLFEEHITDRQISNIITLVASNNRVSAEFADYIDERFAHSVAEGDSKYSYAKAIIESSRALMRGVSPFKFATQLLVVANNDREIITAAQIILMMAWCKYAGINNAFKPYYGNYKMDTDLIIAITQLLGRDVCKTELLKCVKEAILADFASFDDFFCLNNLEGCYNAIENQTNPEDSEIIISLAPIFTSAFQPHKSSSREIRDKYLKRFKKEYEEKEFDKLIFTFSICVAIGCWENDELDGVWALIDKLYSSPKVSKDMGKIRFSELKSQKRRESFERWLETQDFSPDMLTSSELTAFSPNHQIWSLAEHSNNQFIYECGSKKMIVHHSDQPLTPDASGFLESTIVDSPVSNNNFAYLLRRREIGPISLLENGKVRLLAPEELLKDGVMAHEPFSLVNMALATAKIHSNTIGDPEMGRIYLLSQLALSPSSDFDDSWNSVILWWLDLACKRHELEGLIVIHWLLDLKFFIPTKYDSNVLKSLVSLARKWSGKEIKGLQEFISALEHTLALRQP